MAMVMLYWPFLQISLCFQMTVFRSNWYVEFYPREWIRVRQLFLFLTYPVVWRQGRKKDNINPVTNLSGLRDFLDLVQS